MLKIMLEIGKPSSSMLKIITININLSIKKSKEKELRSRMPPRI